MFALLVNLFSKKQPPLSDEELVEAYRRTGDNHHVGLLYERYAHLILGTCMKYLRNEQSASDAALDIFEKLLVSLKKHQVENFRAWLHTLVKNHCLMQLRSQKSQHNREAGYRQFVKDFMEEGEELHLNDGAQDGLMDKLQAAIQHLNDEQRDCVHLYYFEERSYKEISELTGFDDKQVKSYLQNAKRNLRIYLEKHHG
ncbi:MAG: sigma-70 family RNA polymerase sigma factor [Chitinophagales bacterium]|nr:sigma-70 family RNA polymerase sigma factor [Chitinophagales bacterium]